MFFGVPDYSGCTLYPETVWSIRRRRMVPYSEKLRTGFEGISQAL